MDKNVVNLYSDMDLDKAVSHRIHSGIFEIMGYLSIIDKTRMSDEDQQHLFSIKELCKTIITEVHEIIYNYKVKEKN